MDRKKVMYIGIILIITVIVSVTYFSYAFFTNTSEQHGKLNIVVGTLDYKMESDDLDSNNSITLSANQKKEIDVKVTSLNKMDTKYEVYYDANDSVEVKYSIEKDSAVGEIAKDETKNLEIELKNNSNSNQRVTLGVKGGFKNKTLSLSGGQNELDSYVPVSGTNILEDLNSLVVSSDQVAAGENGYLQKQTVSVSSNATLGINSSSYENIIYTGANPNNFIVFNDEMWRIIGIYNEDSHGIADTKLIKIIRNDNLIVSSTDISENGSSTGARWDYKQYAIGSSAYSYGSNEWSDSQLMFMLNGENAINKGKIYNGNAYTYSTSRVDGNYVQVSTNASTYYTIWDKSNGSYLSYDANGDAYINKTIYTSSSVSKTAYSGETAVISKTLSRKAQDKIQEVTWHLGGTNTFNDSSKNNPPGYYKWERTNYTARMPSGYSATSNERCVRWIGKIGLIYASDYGYATSGGTASYRNICMNQQMLGWDSYTDCYTNDWLLYTGATASSKGTASNQWAITPYHADVTAACAVGSNGKLGITTISYGKPIRPVLYLKADTIIADNGADGSFDNPYIVQYD